MCKSNILIVDDAQHAAILAALRVYQMSGGSSIGPDIENIASNGDAFIPLTGDQIDELCESINQASPAKETVIEALKRNHFQFGDFVAPFGVDAESSPYVKAAKERLSSEEGSLEVDEPTIVSESSDGGAYVMAWLWIGDDEAGIQHHSASLERLLDVLAEQDDERTNAHCDWLGDTIANFADEIDEIDAEEVAAREAQPVVWGYEGKDHSFFPSEALSNLLTVAKEHEGELSSDEISSIESFIEQFGDKLNRILRTVELHDANGLQPYQVLVSEGGKNSYFNCLATGGSHAIEQAIEARPNAHVAAAQPKNQVIYSPNESAIGDGAGFWSNDLGWVDVLAATRFSNWEKGTLNLPMSTGQDARWVEVGKALRHYS